MFRTEKDRIDHLLTGHGVEVKEDITVTGPSDGETGKSNAHSEAPWINSHILG